MDSGEEGKNREWVRGGVWVRGEEGEVESG